MVLTIYGSSLGSWPSCDSLFLRLSNRLAEEARLCKELLGLQGMLDLLMASAAAASSVAFQPAASSSSSLAAGGSRAKAKGLTAGSGAAGVRISGQDASAAGELEDGL